MYKCRVEANGGAAESSWTGVLLCLLPSIFLFRKVETLINQSSDKGRHLWVSTSIAKVFVSTHDVFLALLVLFEVFGYAAPLVFVFQWYVYPHLCRLLIPTPPRSIFTRLPSPSWPPECFSSSFSSSVFVSVHSLLRTSPPPPPTCWSHGWLRQDFTKKIKLRRQRRESEDVVMQTGRVIITPKLRALGSPLALSRLCAHPFLLLVERTPTAPTRKATRRANWRAWWKRSC